MHLDGGCFARDAKSNAIFCLYSSRELQFVPFANSVVKTTECSTNRNSWGSCRTEYGRDVQDYKEKCPRLRFSQINNQVRHAPASSCRWRWRGFPWFFHGLECITQRYRRVFMRCPPLKPWAPPCFVAVMFTLDWKCMDGWDAGLLVSRLLQMCVMVCTRSAV